ncbi:unnamed protein product [Protopolystoma xenopodis]|uniref:Uncharacterized protein n=1 Tax=Protopolystoma xenopodis TaxID=117903 RepID=A0A448WHR1_9PLAT|nr:unnamed protein product [Protopolystoma xenopodis]
MMIMLPRSVILVLLSATVPNVNEFADWLGRIRSSITGPGNSLLEHPVDTIHVVVTEKRPVPLEHFLYSGFEASGQDDLYMIVNQQGHFYLPGII